jgi:hypothetical protein
VAQSNGANKCFRKYKTKIAFSISFAKGKAFGCQVSGVGNCLYFCLLSLQLLHLPHALDFPLSAAIIEDHIRVLALEHILRRRRRPALAAKYPHLPQLGEAKPARLMDVGGEGLLYD